MTHGDAIKKLLISTNWNAAGIARVLSCDEKDVWFVAERTDDRRLKTNEDDNHSPKPRKPRPNRSSLTAKKRKEIVEYWMGREDECVINLDDWDDAHRCCWRCSEKASLHKCHIIPDALGGKDELSNLVLLCNRCHEENPNCNDSQFMWKWIQAHKGGPFYWELRALEELKLIFGREAFSLLREFFEENQIDLSFKESSSLAKESWDDLKDEYAFQFNSIRQTHVEVNAATMAWMMDKAERLVIKKMQEGKENE